MYYEFVKCATVYSTIIVKARTISEAVEKASEQIWDDDWDRKEEECEYIRYRSDKDIEQLGECNFKDLKGDNYDSLCNM